ncbi:MAG: hypothetical protein PHC61_16560 [Chitinivibrionales bacterium]|nr:hypothetical protein [Chitinivibrionales bacterium]
MDDLPAIPILSDPPRKNDALFMVGAGKPKPNVHAYEQTETEVVCGPSCKPDREIFLDNCKADGVLVRMRRGGGGVVVLMPGVAVIVIVGLRRSDEAIKDLHRRIHRPLIAILDPAGQIGIRQDGVSDLCIGDQKILGSSLYLGNDPFYFYYQSSLLVNPDLKLIDRYCRHPLREPAYRSGRPHADFCTTLARQGVSCTVKELCEAINLKFYSEFQKHPV